MCEPTSPGEPGPAQDAAGVRIVTLNLPEDEGEGLGFKLTRTLWDPYPWVREVTAGGRAEAAGLRSGDCVLQADGRDLLGLPVGRVAGLIRGDGGGRGASLLVWSCGTSPQDDPELLWSAGGGARGERSRRALGGVLKALACAVCGATAVASRAAQCARGHLYCAGCRARLQRCALCREPLPAPDAPQARNLVAEQVFEAIAAVYELKDPSRATASASTTLSPLPAAKTHSQSQRNSPAAPRKTVQFGSNTPQHHGSDTSLNRPLREWSFRRVVPNGEAVQSESPRRDTGSQTNLDASQSRGDVNSENNQAVQTGQNREDSGDICQNVSKFNSKCRQFNSCGCRCCHNSTNKCEQSAGVRCCQNISVTCHKTTEAKDSNQNTPDSCNNIAETRNHSEGRNSCQNTTETRNCCQKTPYNFQNTTNSCHKSAETNCCHSARGLQCMEPQLYLSQPGLNLVPWGPVGLQHRLVARLRPASSLADLRREGAGGLSKSWSDVRGREAPYAGEKVQAEKSGSVDNLHSETPTHLDEAVYLMTPPPPVYVWAYPQ